MNGFLFPKDNLKALGEIIKQLVWKGKLSTLGHEVASRAKGTARNFGVSEAVEGYAQLLETVLKLPSEVATPKSVGDLSPEFKEQWKWEFFEPVVAPVYQNRTLRSFSFLGKVEELWNQSRRVSSGKTAAEELFVYSIWEQQKSIELAAARKKREDEEVSGIHTDKHVCESLLSDSYSIPLISSLGCVAAERSNGPKSWNMGRCLPKCQKG